MAKSNTKTKPVQDQVEDTAQQTEVPQSVNLSDLGLLLQIVDVATQRGAFRGNELSQVGAVYDKLNAFLSYVQAQQAAQQPEEGAQEPAGE